MIAALLSLLGSSAVGSLIGGVFAFLNRKADVELKRIEFAHELDKRRMDLDIAQAEAKGRLDVAVVEGDATVEAARMSSIGQTQAADAITAEQIKAAGKWGWLLVMSDAARRLIRPGVTVILVGAALWTNYVLLQKLGESWASMTTSQQYDAAMQAFAWVTGQASAVLGYWFVSRGTSK